MADNLAQTRVINPVLTTLARGYRHAMFAWMFLFPVAMVNQRGGKVLTFGAEDFLKRDLIRAPGASRQRLNIGYQGEDYAVEQRALDGVLPRERMEESMAVPGIDLGRRTANQTMQTVSMQIEVAAAALATSEGNFSATHKSTLAGESQWSHAKSLPASAVEEAKEAIASSIGIDPNVMIVGIEVYRKLKNHPDVIDRIKHTQGPGEGTGSVVTRAKLAAYFDVDEFVVAASRAGKVGDFDSLWGKHVILAYSNISTLAQAESDMGEPSFGYCYRLTGYPMVEEPWFDRSCDSWLYPVTCEDSPVIAGKDAGYLFSNVIT